MATEPFNIQQVPTPPEKLTPTEQAIKKYRGRNWAQLRLVGEGDSRHLEFTNRFGKIWDVVFSRDKEKRVEEHNLRDIISFIEKADVSSSEEKNRALDILREKRKRQEAKARSATVGAREEKTLEVLATEASPVKDAEISEEDLGKIQRTTTPQRFDYHGQEYTIVYESAKEMIRINAQDSPTTMLLKLTKRTILASAYSPEKTIAEFSAVYLEFEVDPTTRRIKSAFGSTDTEAKAQLEWFNGGVTAIKNNQAKPATE